MICIYTYDRLCYNITLICGGYNISWHSAPGAANQVRWGAYM